MPFAPLNDGSIYYEVHGQGPPLFLIPGLNGVGSFWSNIHPGLAAHFTVVVHDHRGTGQSSRSAIRYSIEQMRDDVLGLMDHLGLQEAHFVGHSTGGAILQAMAIDTPALVQSMVLSATWAGPDPYFERLFESRKRVLTCIGPRAYLRASHLAAYPPHFISANAARLDQEEEASLSRFPPEEIQVSRIEAIVRHDRRAQLGKITQPCLILCARNDMVAPMHYSQELAQLIPDAELNLLDDGGHLCPVIHSAPYCDALLDFLGRHAAG